MPNSRPTQKSSAFLTLLLVFLGCGGGEDGITAPEPPASVASVSVTIQASSLVAGATTQATAITRDVNGNVLSGRVVDWTSSNAAIATVNASGIISAAAAGTASITATVDSRSGSASLTVTQVPVATVAAVLTASNIIVGGTTQAISTLKDGNGNILTGRAVVWTSTNTSIATVTSTGVVTGVAVGTATIGATSEGQTGSAELTVSAVPVATVHVSLAQGSVVVGASTNATALVKDANGTVLMGRAVTWESSNIAIATVTENGSVTGAGTGSATITATSEGQKGSANLTVTAVPVATVSVSLAEPTLAVGSRTQATASVKDANGNVLTGRSVAWFSSDPNIASVILSTGVVTAVAPGNAQIIAESENMTGRVSIAVISTPVNAEQRSIAAGYIMTCALTAGGNAYCWGRNQNGSLGNGELGSSSAVPSPTQVVGGLTFKAIYASNSSASGGSIVCGLTPDGHAYCWGPVFMHTPASSGSVASPTLISSTLTFSRLSVGPSHACGITGDQSVYCWGSNNYGELLTQSAFAQGSTTPLLALGGQRVVDVAAGSLYTCAILTSGQTLCAGVNNWSQVGAASGSVCNGIVCNPTPVALNGPVFARVSAGREFACGLTSSGAAYCWGYNAFGQLGLGNVLGPGREFDVRATPQTVVGGHTFSTLSVGAVAVCGIAGSTTYCWGLLDGTPSSSPAAVSTPPALSTISVGADQACGADASGRLWCWGGNGYGQLGDGTFVQHLSPAVVPGFVVGVP